ncbi:MAG: hypothetical protein JSV42_04460 [Chloroflexota bacterium]|nr:MAG: hypothetical protein JSV42_04460 [Chloroflexota bacterium]
MIQEIIAHLKEEDLEISFHMDSINFDEDVLEMIEKLGWRFVIKGNVSLTLVARLTDPDIIFDIAGVSWDTTGLVTTLNTGEKYKRFILQQVLKDEKDIAQLSILEIEEFSYPFLIANTDLSYEEIVEFYQKYGASENCIKEANYDMGDCYPMLNNLSAPMKQDSSRWCWLAICFCYSGVTWLIRWKLAADHDPPLKYVFLAEKIIRTARRGMRKLSDSFPYQEIYGQSLSGRTVSLLATRCFSLKVEQETPIRIFDLVRLFAEK